jgi:hypothetical protein
MPDDFEQRGDHQGADPGDPGNGADHGDPMKGRLPRAGRSVEPGPALARRASGRRRQGGRAAGCTAA